MQLLPQTPKENGRGMRREDQTCGESGAVCNMLFVRLFIETNSSHILEALQQVRQERNEREGQERKEGKEASPWKEALRRMDGKKQC